MKARDLASGTGAVLAALVALQLAGSAQDTTSLKESAVYVWESLAPTATQVGQVRRVLRRPTATLAELESHITTLNPGQTPHPPHTHVNEEMIILKEGSLEAYVNGTWTPVSTGSMIFFGSNVPHSVRNSGTAPATYYVVNWSPHGLAKGGSAAAR